MSEPTKLTEALSQVADRVTIGADPSAVRSRARSIRRRRWAATLVGAVAVAGSGLFVVNDIVATGSTGPATDPSQSTCMHGRHHWGAGEHYLDSLVTLASRQPNYAGETLCLALHQIHLAGVGSPTRVLAERIAQAPATVQVVWHSVPFTLKQIIAAGKEAANGPGAPQFLVSFSPGGPPSGLVVTGLEIGVRRGSVTLDEARAIVEARITNGVRVVEASYQSGATPF